MYASHLNQCEGLGHLGGREPVLLRVVEPAAVDAPELAGHACLGVLRPLRRTQREVEPDEVEGGADPRDPGGHVEHRGGGRRGRPSGTGPSILRDGDELAAARCRAPPRACSRSAREAPRRISRFGLPVDEDDEAEAELLLVHLVQVRELGEDGGVGRPRPARRQSAPRDRGAGRSRDAPRAPRPCRPRRASRGRRPPAPSGSSVVGELLDEARAALEELRELLDRQLPR